MSTDKSVRTEMKKGMKEVLKTKLPSALLSSCKLQILRYFHVNNGPRPQMEMIK